MGLTAFATACAGPIPEPPADLVVFGGDVHTVDAWLPHASAFAVRAGRFLGVGRDAEMRALAGPDTELVDARGATVVPGFIDGHVHFGSGLPLVRGVNLYGIASRAEWLRRIAARASELPVGAWIVGGRWDHTLAGDELPTRHELDAITPDHPVALSDVDGHSTWANSLALRLAGVDATTPDPPGGRVLREPDGTPTGILLEAGGLLSAAIPEPSESERVDALRDTLAYASSLGITGAHDMAGAGSRLDEYAALLEAGTLNVRIWFGAYADLDNVTYLSERRSTIAARAAAVGAPGPGPWLQLGYAKLVIDGVLSTRTAAMLEPYADAPGETGLPSATQHDLDTTVIALNRAGFPVAIHAIGDRGVRMALNAFEASLAANGPAALPNRIEHNEVVDPADAGRYGALGVLASMNPHHCISGIDKYNTARLGPTRAAWSFPWGRLRDAGATLVFGSDWATAPLNPLEHLYAAVLREKPEGGPAGGWYADNRLTWEQALRAYTLAPAIAAGQDDEIGSISAGKAADFVILEGALPSPPDASLQQMKVRETRVAGRRVYGLR